MADDYSSPANARKAAMMAVRRDIHAHPELAFEEHRTSDLVAARLEALGLEVHRGLARTGLVGTLRNGNGRSVGLRADMDALPLEELGTPEHRSTHHGVMHACGHDGHTAMLLGAAEELARTRRFNGTVHVIFQPAEENLGGGRVMVEEGLFQKFPCEAVFALHNWPGIPAGHIAVQPGPMMASYDTFSLIVTGVGGHAAMPEKAKDPIVASAELILALQTIVSRKVSPHEAAVVTVTAIKGGETFNVIPEEVELKGTVRCFSPEVRRLIFSEIDRMASAIAGANDLSIRVRLEEGYPSTLNTDAEARFAADVARRLFGDARVQTNFRPSMASEDFSLMLEAVPGAYIWLGAGTDAAPLHNPHYDFNDDTLLTGSDLLVALAEDFLK